VRDLQNSGRLYTWDLFERKVNLHAFLKRFESAAAGIFRRGSQSAHVFLSVLRTGSVADTDCTSEDDTSALQQCFRDGWLHTDMFVDDDVKYFFLSSLHRWYEWKLWDVADTDADGATSDSFDCADILDLVINVISTFSPARVSDSTPRRDADTDTDIISPGGVRRPPDT
jgi:hypothetical protein